MCMLVWGGMYMCMISREVCTCLCWVWGGKFMWSVFVFMHVTFYTTVGQLVISYT